MRLLKHVLAISVLVLTLMVAFVYQPFTTAIASTPPAVDSAALQNHVHYLSVDVYPSSFDVPHNLNATADHIKEEWQRAGIQVSEQTFDVQGTSYRNIIVHFGPTADINHPVTVIGAH